MAGSKYKSFNKCIKSFLVGLLCFHLLLLAACKTSCIMHPTNGTSLDQSHATLQQAIAADQKLSRKPNHIPNNVSSALLSTNSTLPDVGSTERRFNISANKTPARAFFMGLVSGTQYNMVVNPNVKGDISLELKNVLLDGYHEENHAQLPHRLEH